MHTTYPNSGYVFYRPIILHHICGAISFEDMQTHSDVQHTTFNEACVTCSLLEDHNEWFVCLEHGKLANIFEPIRCLFDEILEDFGHVTRNSSK